jgi:hypothetical protein
MRRVGEYLVLFLLFALILVASFIMPPASGPTQTKARILATKAELSLFEKSLDKYHRDFGSYPKELKLLWAPPPEIEPATWKGPYMEGDAEVPDAWGHNFDYLLLDDGHGCKITSAGPDGEFGTEDDIEQTYRYGENRDSLKIERSGEP